MSDQNPSPQTIDELATAMRQGFEKIERRRRLEVLTPVIVVVIAAVFGLVGYSYEKGLDRTADLQKLKREAYTSYLQTLQYAISGANGRRFNAATENLLLIASDDVLKAVQTFHSELSIQGGPSTDADRARVFGVMKNMYQAMRADGFEPTDLSDEKVIALIETIASYRWGPY